MINRNAWQAVRSAWFVALLALAPAGALGNGSGNGSGIGSGIATGIATGSVPPSTAQEHRHQQRPADREGFQLRSGEGKIDVYLDGQLMTTYDYASHAKPVLYPVYADGQVAITRHFPMRRDVAGEADDHPHQKSLWFAHGDVNGVDFWSERGRIAHQRVVALDDDPEQPSFTTANAWMDGERTLVTDTTTITLGRDGSTRWIDHRIQLYASHGPVRLGDTKEGTFGVRTHPALRLQNDPRRGVTGASGQAINSRGDRDAQLWGKRAEWVAYWGQIEDQTFAVAILDHPSNLRHPTTWHAREYGLVAANPFGLSYFLDQPPGSGDLEVAEGQSLSLVYRVVIHRGEPDVETIAQWFEAFSR